MKARQLEASVAAVLVIVAASVSPAGTEAVATPAEEVHTATSPAPEIPGSLTLRHSPTPLRVLLETQGGGDPWWEIVGKVSGSLAAIVSAIAALYALIIPARNYLQNRASELRWKQFETTRKIWSDFTSDDEMREVIRLIETRSPELRAMFTTPAEAMSPDAYVERNRVDRYFEFLESLVYAIDSQTLSRQDVAVFGWHFDQFIEFPELGEYCRDRAYGAVVRFAEVFRDRPPLFPEASA